MLGVSQKLFLHAILAGRRQEAVRFAIEALRQGHTVTDIYVELFETSLYQVGRLWEANQITVAEEHMATAITQHAIAQLYAQLTPAEAERGRIVLTGVQGELHQVGATMVADVLEADGWDVRFLGTNMPYAGILQAIEAHQAEILGISATMLFSVPQLRQLIGEVRSRFGPRSPRIVLGGAALSQLPDLAAEVGAVLSATDLRGVGNLMQTVIAAGPHP
jgi:MerR family transcriptional regulator, light-induced transcriptional regulator